MSDPKDNKTTIVNKQKGISPEQIIHASNAGLAIIDESGILIDFNAEFINLLPGISACRSFSDFITIPEQQTDFAAGLASNQEHFSIKTSNKIDHLVLLKFTRIESSEDTVYYLATARSEYSPYSNIFIQQLIDSIPDIIFIKDNHCRYILANKWAAKIMGADTTTSLLGYDDFSFYPEEIAKSAMNDDKKVIDSGKAILNKQEKIIVDGQTKYYSTTKVPLRDRNGNSSGIMGIGRDITQHIKEKKSLEKAWQEAEKADNLKSTFLANLSHEIRTPLNGILGFSQFLKQKSHSVEKQHKYLDIIHNNGKQLLMLLNDIIDISMIESNQVAIKKQVFRINGLLGHLYTNFDHQINEKGANLKLISKPGLPDKNDMLFSDDYRLHQILGNLIGNAIKFTKSGTIEYGYTLKNDTLTFFVEDTGVGIAPKQQKEIFLRFRQADESITRKFGGTGLGLSICKGLVEMLGGEISVMSKPGKGSRFFFTIPYVTSEQ